MRSHLAIVFAVLVITLLITGSALFAWKQNPLPSAAERISEAVSPMRLASIVGEVQFSHPRHGAATCVDCHHKTIDANPYRRCHDCHRQQDRKIISSQKAFHQTCIECHEQTLKNGALAPSRRCSSCHRKDGELKGSE